MYWPNIDKDIDKVRSNCNACQKYWNLNPCKPLLLLEIPKDVSNEVVTGLNLIITDYSSKYFELAQLPNASSDTVIIQMRSLFSRHGEPSVVFSDNGPQHSSYEIKKFSKSWDFIPSSRRIIGFCSTKIVKYGSLSSSLQKRRVFLLVWK